MRRKLLWLAFILHLLSVAIALVEFFWNGSVESGIYNAVQAIRPDPNSQQPDIWIYAGRWLIIWWFFVVLFVQFITWMTALLLAATEPHAEKWRRVLWCLAILLLGPPAVMAYCLVKLWPNNSFKPTPHRGSARVHTLR
jgi:hypothetical protein